MKPALIIALIGIVSGILAVHFSPIPQDIFLPCYVFSLLLIVVLYSQFPKKRTVTRDLIVFILFFGLGSLKQQLNLNKTDYINLNHLSNKVIFGEIIQVKTNAENYHSYQIQTKFYYSYKKRKAVDTKIVLICQSDKVIPVGNQVLFKAALTPFETIANPGAFDAASYYRNHGFAASGFLDQSCIQDVGKSSSISAYFLRWQNYLGQTIDDHFNSQVSGIAKALILGDKNAIDPEIVNAFSNTGAMHVLAVSGLHVGILLYLIQFLLTGLHRIISKRQALLIALLCIWFFTFLSGSSPSVLRSTIMFTILTGGNLFYRNSNPLNSLVVSALLLLAYNSSFLFDIGFQLSYLALAGIFLFQKSIQNYWNPKYNALRWLWNGTAVGIAATIATTPIMLYYFNQFPNYFLLSNVVVMLFGSVVLIGLSLFLVLSKIPYLNFLIAFCCGWVLIGLLFSIMAINDLPGAVSQGFHFNINHVLFTYLLVLLWIVPINPFLKKWRLVPVLGLFLLVSWNRFNTQQNACFFVLNDTKFCALIQYQGKACFIFDPSLSEKKKTQFQLNYSRYYGVPIKHAIALKSKNNLRIGRNEIAISKTTTGYVCLINGKKIAYYNYNSPIPDKRTWLNTTLFKKFNGKMPASNYCVSLLP